MAELTATEEKEQKVMDPQHNGYSVLTSGRLEPLARLLLMGVYDDNNILSTLRGMRYIVKDIWQFALQFNDHYWYKHINKNGIFLQRMDQTLKTRDYGWNSNRMDEEYDEPNRKGIVIFPKPTGININMMPFIMHNEFNKTKLPIYLQSYFNKFILPCLRFDESQKYTICYLSIQESLVETDKTQRRPNIHVEHPGFVQIDECHGDGHRDKITIFCGQWGAGELINKPTNGIYMASNVAQSCVAWNCKIIADDYNKKEVIGHLGDIQHLKRNLPTDKMKILEPNILYWFTDRTPHESLPIKQTTYRQWFRLVTHKISVWHQANSTMNPNGVMPDIRITKIIKRNKFDIDDQQKYDLWNEELKKIEKEKQTENKQQRKGLGYYELEELEQDLLDVDIEQFRIKSKSKWTNTCQIL